MMYRSLVVATRLCALLAFACGKTPGHQDRHGFSEPYVANDVSGAGESTSSLNAKPAEGEVALGTDQAQLDFVKLRDAFRQTVGADLTTLDRKIAVLEGKAKYTSGRAKNKLETSLTQIRADRYTFMNDYKSLDTATRSSWEAAKEHIDKEWNALTDLVNHS